jgi:hypothetical protein
MYLYYYCSLVCIRNLSILTGDRLMVCCNQCEKYRAIRSHEGAYYTPEGRYEKGQKRCQVCEIFIDWQGIRCPCCHATLRTRPRPKKYREKLVQKISKHLCEQALLNL